QVGVVALAVALIGVATCDRTLGLKVVGNGDERLGDIFGDRLEFLSQWLTRSAGEAVIFKDAGFAYWLYAVRVVDKCHADDVRGSGDLFWGLDVFPVAAFSVECVHQRSECFVAAFDIAGDRE